MPLEQYQLVRGILKPQRTDDLYPDTIPFIGTECNWRVAWKIDEGDYEGMWALSPEDDRARFAWAPECDVELVFEEKQ